MTQQSTMRDLLARWAATEPGKCHLHEEIEGFTVSSGKWWYLVLDSNLAEESNLIKIQWAVQQAIVSRGWSFELKYDPDWPDPRYEATVDSNKSGGWEFGNDGFVAPLLAAYLHTLEGENELTNKKAG